MSAEVLRGRRAVTAAVLLVAGGALAIGVWASGDHGFAVGLGAFYVLAALGAYAWSAGTGDVAAILRVGGDERQRMMDRQATLVAGAAVLLCCFIGAVVDLARGGDGHPYAWLLAVAGGTYVVTLAWIKRRT
ncbi:MAG: hypothetical protein QOE35_3849 [Actinomycetota bacterium]|jgi:hypothetical protein